MCKKIKIIYVDDEEINVQLFEINFSLDYDVYTAYNGFEGLELLKNNSDAGVVLSDMKMPGMNGIEFIKKAKELYPEKKFYILTGFEKTKEIQEALNSGLINEYFSKPFDVPKIKNTIDKHIKNSN